MSLHHLKRNHRAHLCRLLLLWLFLLPLNLPAQSTSGRDLEEQFQYRSIAFNGLHKKGRTTAGSVIHPAVLREIAEVGFNDVCFHLERGPKTAQFENLHAELEATGLLEVIEEMGFTTTVWMHEFNEYDPAWGEPSADNEVIWQNIREKYEGFLELWPEIDYLVMTNAETQVTPEDRRTFAKIYQTVDEVIRAHGGELIVRSFFHGPLHVWKEQMIPSVPDQAWIQHKYVDGDWSLRRPDNPLISVPGEHRMVVEFDIGGEYQEQDQILNCFADELAERMENTIIPSGARGISVRINRHDGTAWNHPNAINYWYLGLLTSGQVDNVDQAWQRYCTAKFGPELSQEMTAILRPTGEVTAEALSFGNSAYGNSSTWLIGGKPYGRGWGRKRVRFDDPLFLPPHTSFEKDDPRYEKHYQDFQAQMRGDTAWLNRESEAYARQLGHIEHSLIRFKALRERVEPETFAYIKWLLEETRWNLITLQEAQLAHFKVFRILEGVEPAEERELLERIEAHLAAIERQNEKRDENFRGSWNGVPYRKQRGSYASSKLFLVEFRLWLQWLGLGEPLQIVQDGWLEEVDTYEKLITWMVREGWEEQQARKRMGPWVLGYLKQDDPTWESMIDGLFGAGKLPRRVE
jgi:hypothetical protein